MQRPETPSPEDVAPKSPEQPVWNTWWFWTVIAVGLVVVAIVVIVSVLYASPDVHSASSSVSSLLVCTDPDDQIPLFVQLVEVQNYAIMSTESSIPGAQVQDGGDPSILMCASSGPGRIPIYQYVNPADAADVRWGTSSTAPTGYSLGNNSLPLGYIYADVMVNGVQLHPVYENVANFNRDYSHVGILTHRLNAEYGGVNYASVTVLPIGYSLARKRMPPMRKRSTIPKKKPAAKKRRATKTAPKEVSREFVETPYGKFTAYNIPKGTKVYHGTAVLSTEERELILERANWFAINKQEAAQYGRTVFEFEANHDISLIALDLCKNVKMLGKIKKDIEGYGEGLDYEITWQEDFQRGWDCLSEEGAPIRFSTYEADRRFVSALCKMGFEGYASGKLRQFKGFAGFSKDRSSVDPEPTFHAELYLCKPFKHLKYVDVDPNAWRRK